MKNLLIFFVLTQVLLSSVFAAKPAFAPYQAYLNNLEDDEEVSVFSKKGLNWKSCNQVFDPITQDMKCKEAIGWPGRDAKIMVLGPPENAVTIDPFTNEEVVEKYVKISFEYQRIGEDGKIHFQKGVGYIEEYNLSKNLNNSFFGVLENIKDKAIELCIPKPKPEDILNGHQSVIKDLTKIISANAITKTAEQVGQFVGMCPLKPATEFPRNLIKDQNTYDQLVLTRLNQVKLPPIEKENGNKLTNQDLINIDAIARTLYGEMGQCFRHGLQYPMAVAKIIINRANETGRIKKVFIQPPHVETKPTIAQAATTPQQFSMWQSSKRKIINKKKARVPNEPLHQGLCPPKEKGKPFYHGQSASKFEHDIWTNAVRIATEAIVFPNKFNKRTKEINEFYYTSDLAKFKNTKQLSSGARFINSMDQVFPSIEGRKIVNNKCIEIWKDE